MAKYTTADDVEVKAQKRKDSDVWDIEFPGGEVREMHDSQFADNFKEVK